MAWISVEQTLIGKKLRVLAKDVGCSQNEAIGILVNLWLWGMDNASMDGLMDGADIGDVALAIKPCLSESLDPEEVVSKLIENGWIDCSNGDLFIHDWEEYRYYYNKYVSEKKQHSKRQREYVARKRAAEKAKYEPEENGTEKPDEEGKKVKKTSPYSSSFEELWNVYPRKKDKGNAYKKYKARLNDGWSEEELLAAVVGYATECKRNRTDEKYIKHASTFFSETTPFVDYLKKKEMTAKSDMPDESNPFR
ncbi:MAG: hypothetical protein ACI4EO_07750 [Blautia sp.]